uniref:Uncharacterized protein n=1 Tax=Panagrolaimus davidi TaxID=227884 RepID=A0A914Q3M6_9BILA
MHSNEINSIQAKGRSDNKKDEQNSQHQNNSQTAASRQQFIPPSSLNGFPQQPQAFMNSYPFMASQNGMLQPQQMYMGLPLQGQGQQPNLQNNINQSEF